MADRLPPLNTLRVFEAVARHMSFTRAAEELGMTQAAVSYQIKLLEDRLGAPVFRRMTRKLMLTDAGARLAPAVADAFGRLRGAFQAIATQNEGVLAVTSVVTFASNWLVPRIGWFQLAWPGIAVRIETEARLIDFAREEFDVGIRGGRHSRSTWPGLASHYLMSIDLMPFCAPSLLAEYGPASSAEDLLRWPLIGAYNVEVPHPLGVEGDWGDWFRAAGCEIDRLPTFKAHLASQQMQATAVLAGQGAALLSPRFFKTEIETGRMVPAHPARLAAIESYHLVCLETRRDTPKIKAFREWLLAELAKDGGDEIGKP